MISTTPGTTLAGVAAGMIKVAGFIAVAIPAGLAGFSFWTARRVRRSVPPAGRMIDIGGEQIHVSDQGSGPAIVLVHGLAGNMRNLLAELAPRLAKDFRVIAIDRPGSGYSIGASGRSRTVRAHAWVVRDVIAALKLERPLIVGHSLGGAIALATALDHPEHVGGLALLSPFTNIQSEPLDVFKGLAITNPLQRRIVAWTLAVPMMVRNSAASMRVVFGPEQVPASYSIEGGGLLALQPSAYESASGDYVAVMEDMPGLIARYGTLTLPIGVLYGSDDRVLSARGHGAVMQDRIPGLEYEEIKGAGHMIPLTRPDETAAFIRRIAARMT